MAAKRLHDAGAEQRTLHQKYWNLAGFIETGSLFM